MRLPDVLKLSGSLGRRIGEGSEPETFAWCDNGGDEVVVELKGGLLTAWRLQRAETVG